MASSVLSALNITTDDKMIAVRENKYGDGNFILTSILSKCISNQENICLIIVHNTLGHYQNVGKKLDYDLLNEIKEGRAKVVEPLKDIAQDISKNVQEKKYLVEDKEVIVKNLFMEIKTLIDELSKNNRRTTIIIDDVSHLLDLNIDLKYIIKFLRHCNYLITQSSNVAGIINCHVACEASAILSNTLFHFADVLVTVSSLKTGRSRTVSGVLYINKINNDQDNPNKQSVYHYKLMDREIRVFTPGKALI